MGDTKGDHRWIDITASQDCDQSCLSRLLDPQSGSDVFTFVVEKNTKDLWIRIHSVRLEYELKFLLGSSLIQNNGLICGLTLLKHHDLISTHLFRMRQNQASEQKRPEIARSVEEMTMLVNGLLEDPDIYRSFGYEYLAEHGYLCFDLWKRFQQTLFNRSINRLENAFDCDDDCDADSDSDDGEEMAQTPKDLDSPFRINSNIMATNDASCLSTHEPLEEFGIHKEGISSFSTDSSMPKSMLPVSANTNIPLFDINLLSVPSTNVTHDERATTRS